MATLDAWSRMGAPNLDAVLANIGAGRTARLYLNPAQKQARADGDGQIARRVLHALLQAQHEATTDTRIYRFPLTTDCFAAVARTVGTPVGKARARTIVRRLIDCGILTDLTVRERRRWLRRWPAAARIARRSGTAPQHV